MLAMLFGAIQFGYAFYQYNNLEKAVRDGCRYASNRAYVTGDADFAAQVKNVVVYGRSNPAADAKPVVHGLTTSLVQVTPPTGTMTTVNVRITTYTMDLPLTTVTLTNKPNVTFRYIGRYVP